MDLVVSPAGTVTAIYDEALDLHAIGRPQIVRASHVEPDADGRWFAAIVGGPTLGPFERRSLALAAEIAWLTEHRLQRAGSVDCFPLQPTLGEPLPLDP